MADQLQAQKDSVFWRWLSVVKPWKTLRSWILILFDLFISDTVIRFYFKKTCTDPPWTEGEFLQSILTVTCCQGNGRQKAKCCFRGPNAFGRSYSCKCHWISAFLSAVFCSFMLLDGMHVIVLHLLQSFYRSKLFWLYQMQSLWHYCLQLFRHFRHSELILVRHFIANNWHVKVGMAQISGGIVRKFIRPQHTRNKCLGEASIPV